MASLKEELALLIGKYGVIQVHDELMNRMTLEYRYLRKLFEGKDSKKPVEKIVIVEEKTEEKVEEENKNTVVSVEEKKEEKGEEVKKFKDSKEQKAWQKEMEEKKKKELEAKGIQPKSLLTKENLKKWIEEEGRTFSYIAREYTGTRDYEVSSAAKLFGIENTRKNLTIQTKK